MRRTKFRPYWINLSRNDNHYTVKLSNLIANKKKTFRNCNRSNRSNSRLHEQATTDLFELLSNDVGATSISCVHTKLANA